jgi:3-hydroxy-9,10-secoandrosta-1,3,5(10)-triene-9,17-dione monooxygenase reductase component
VIDARAFRDALGQFATGVAIVTACGEDGERVGATVSSFNSVSLDPPLVLWSLDKNARSRAAFEASTHFAVHILTVEQRELAQLFARRGADKFAGLQCRQGVGGVPLLEQCAACFECETRHRYDGGDHIIFVGEVLQFERQSGSPLLFHGGSFRETRQHLPHVALDAAVDEASGRFGPDFISYLVSRAHFQLYRPLAREFERVGISETEYFTLSMLCIRERISYEVLTGLLDHTGYAPTREQIAELAQRGLISIEHGDASPTLAITDLGRRLYVLVLAVDGRLASQALRGFAPQEIADFAGYIKRLIANTCASTPDVWTCQTEPSRTTADLRSDSSGKAP